ncbi:MAG: hypothetical protein V3U06_08900, partial [Candidatus Binatia bacterium]
SGELSNVLGLPPTSTSLCLRPPGFLPRNRMNSNLGGRSASKRGRRPILKQLEENGLTVLVLRGREVEVHRLPLWFDIAHHPEPAEGRSGPPAHHWSTILFTVEPIIG